MTDTEILTVSPIVHLLDPELIAACGTVSDAELFRVSTKPADVTCHLCIQAAGTDPDENECEGHESLAGEHMGETVYCDGSCRRAKPCTFCKSTVYPHTCSIRLVDPEPIRDVTVQLVNERPWIFVVVDGVPVGKILDGTKAVIRRTDKILHDAGVARQGYSMVDGVATARARRYTI